MKRYVKIKGQTYPLELTQEAVLQMAMDEGLAVDQIPALTHITHWPLKQMLLYLLYSIKLACEADGIQCHLTLADIRNAIATDAEFQADIKKIGDASVPVVEKKKVPVRPVERQRPI